MQERYTEQSKLKDLIQGLLMPNNSDEMASLCRDLLTESEIRELSDRFAVAKQLYAGKSQRKVSSSTNVSIATVTRVNKWLRKGRGGYRLVLDRMNDLHSHSSQDKLVSTS